MRHIVVDPITRIEGHLRVEAQVDEGTGRVTDALSSGTAWRGLELIMHNRDPRDAWAYIQRVCGVCTTAHALCSVRAVEDALGIRIPRNANYIRNIMAASLTVQDHTVHFYHLHALDWVSPVEALAADPIATANLQTQLLATLRLPFRAPVDMGLEAYPKSFPNATPEYFNGFKQKIQQIMQSGKLGIFSANWWDHPDYKLLPPEVHLLAIVHYLELLDKHRELVLPHVIFGGKNPHPHYVVGGMPCAISLDDGNAPINAARLAIVDRSLDTGREVVNDFYVPDLLAIGSTYVRAGRVDGGGLAKRCVLGFGAYPLETYSGFTNGDFHSNLLVRCNGVVENLGQGLAAATYTDVKPEDFADPSVLTEGVQHAWYKYDGDKTELHPWEGQTHPEMTGPKEGTPTNWQALNENGKYSWLKTPKWRGKLAEVGPLARYIIVYVKSRKGLLPQPTWAEQMMLDQLAAVSTVLNLPAETWLPTMVGRTAARGLEAQLSAEIAKFFYKKLIDNLKSGDLTTTNSDKWDVTTWPKEARGVGLYEAPRGALSHWVTIKDGKIDNYQCVVPTTWNACPRDDEAGHGAYEAAMMDTHVLIPEKPLEIVKVIRSFDPCMACATHVINAAGKELCTTTTDPYLGNFAK